MKNYFHSVRLEPRLCQGCVTCAKRCPTEAIRVRGGKAQIIEERCIDCGECIRSCPAHAKTAVTDSISDLKAYKYNIALPAPALYSQFSLEYTAEQVLCAFRLIGFDEVFEVAHGAEIVTLGIREYLKRTDIPRPAISAACPTTVRLIQVKFPELIENLIPIDAPVEVAARVIRARAAYALGMDPAAIGIWFITPCPAKMTAIQQPLGSEKSNITGAIDISKIYGTLLHAVKKVKDENPMCKRASWAGIGWALSGGEAAAIEAISTKLPAHIVVDGIRNVNELLEQITMGKIKGIQYVEALACAGGCIGGALMVENRFVAEHRMKTRLSNMKEDDSANSSFPREYYYEEDLALDEWKAIEPRPILRLDSDIYKAMEKIEIIDKTLEKLPGLDCGSCGSPTCKALAEDIAQGLATETDCVFKLRERVRDLAKEMVELAEKMPPSLEKKIMINRMMNDDNSAKGN